jgi:hypothetical protein
MKEGIEAESGRISRAKAGVVISTEGRNLSRSLACALGLVRLTALTIFDYSETDPIMI